MFIDRRYILWSGFASKCPQRADFVLDGQVICRIMDDMPRRTVF